MTGSLHRRLLVLVGACSAVTLAVLGIAVCLLVESQLWSQFDAGLRDRLIQLTHLVEQEGGRISFEWEEGEAIPLHADGERMTCWDEGRVVEVLPKGATPLPTPIDNTRLYAVAIDGQSARVFVQKFAPRVEDDSWVQAKTITIAVARTTHDVLATIRIIRWSLATATGFGLMLTLAGTWVAVRRGLSPVRVVTDEIAQISPNRLHQHVEGVTGQPTELQPLLSTINQLLSRLQVAMERERAFSSEIAHELRTPLAGLRAKFDVALSRERSASELREIVAECARINDAATAMVDSLMATVVPVVANGEAGQHQAANLSRLVEEAVLQFDDPMTQRGLNIEHDIANNVIVRGGEHAINIALRNLIDNVVSYSDENSTVTIQCRKEGGGARLSMRNTASDFPLEQIAQVFERFWRADAARSDSAHHSGLGLALTKRIVEANGGTISANYEEPRFEVIVTWNKPNGDVEL